MDNTNAPKPGWNNWKELGTYIAAVQQKASAHMSTTAKVRLYTKEQLFDVLRGWSTEPQVPTKKNKVLIAFPDGQSVATITKSDKKSPYGKSLYLVEILTGGVLMPDTRPKFYLCGGCKHWHPFGWTGDCRDNRQRFTTDKLDTLYPDKNGDGWPDWVEVDEEIGG